MDTGASLIGWSRRSQIQLVIAALVISFQFSPSVGSIAAAGSGAVAGSAVIPIPQPSSLADWAQKPAQELAEAGLVAISQQAPELMTRGSFMTLAAACSGRSAAVWPEELRRQSIQVGRPGDDLAPDAVITRSEAVTFLVKLLRAEAEAPALEQVRDSSGAGGPDVREVPPPPVDIAGHWAESFFDDAVRWGLVRGRPDGTVGPDAPLSLAEGLTLADRFLHAGEGLLPLDPPLTAAADPRRAVEAHVQTFVDVFSREPYDFARLLATCVGQAKALIAQNQEYYVGRYARGSRFRFELLSFEATVASRSLFIAIVTTRERMREYADGRAEESEYADRMFLRRVGQTWLIYK